MRVSTSKSKNSESFYINFSYIDEHGKSTSKIFKKLGTLEQLSKRLNTDRNGVMAWAKQQAKEETRKYLDENERVLIPLSPNAQIKKGVDNSFNCGYLFLQSICTKLRFDNTCRNIKSKHNYEYNLQSILTDLIYARILSPSSKTASYDYACTLLEKPSYQLHDVYRALQVLAKHSDMIQAETYRNSQFIQKRNTKVLYYDCTNYYFEIEQEKNQQKYGKGKEHRPNPIVGMGLFMDGDGLPLAFDLHPGSQNEQLTLRPLEKKVIEDFDCSQFIYCSDSGLASKNNKLFNDMDGRGYVITQSLKKISETDRKIALNPKQYRKVSGDGTFIDLTTLNEEDPEVFNSIYYKEIPIKIKKFEETMIVTYSPKYKAYQAKIRQAQIERAQGMIASSGKLKKNHRNPNDPARFLKTIATTEDGEVAKETYCELDQEVISKEQMYDGFYAVTTDLDGDVKDIVNVNKRRWQIEECFRIMKTEFKARPVYLSREDSIKAHFLTCFLALLVYRILEIKLDKKYTCESIIDTLSSMDLLYVDGQGYIPEYKRTDLTDDLHKVFNFRTDYEFTSKSRLRSIIHQTKEIK